jgi:DNA-directed RNA polymerase subunit RPC12/RpoP/flagellar basal body-associated protein FliL
MESKSFFKSFCARCGEHIEAPTEGAGMWIRCPHCGEKTQLVAPPPEVEATAEPIRAADKPSTRITWVVIAAVALCVLVAVGAVTFFFSQGRKNRAATGVPSIVRKTPKPKSAAPAVEAQPDLWKGLKPGPITIEKSGKSRLVYAIGTIRNDTDKQRYGVKVTLDVLDSKSERVGTTTDYTQFIDAHKEWTFKALITGSKAASAKITSISED